MDGNDLSILLRAKKREGKGRVGAAKEMEVHSRK